MAVAEQPLHGVERSPAERDWPATTRLLPWLAVLAIATVLVVPIDSMTLPVPVPFDARPDRLLLIVCFGLWLLAVAVREPGQYVGPRHRMGLVEVLLVLFVCAAVLSVAQNATELNSLDEASTAYKKLVLLGSYVGFYFLVVGTIGADEVPAVVRLVVTLGAIAAIGTILQFVTGRNLFFTVAAALSPPGTHVAPGALLESSGGRPDITGPARHGLAITAELAMILPLALVGAVFAESRRDRLLYRIAAACLFAGCLFTFRRSGVVLPFLAASAVVLGGGRRMLPLAAVFVVLVLATPIVAHGAVSELVGQFSSSNAAAQQSIQGRTADYSAIVPDVVSHAVLGRGFGSYDPHRYRVLDNQYLLSLVETGAVGLAAYVALMLGGAGMALRIGVRRAGPASWIGLAVFGSVLAFMAANALFDALSFPQAPYTFLLVLALAGIARRASQKDEAGSARALAF